MKYTILSLLAHLALLPMALVWFSPSASIAPINNDMPDAINIHTIYRQPSPQLLRPSPQRRLAPRPAAVSGTNQAPADNMQPAGESLATNDNYAAIAPSNLVLRDQPQLINDLKLSTPYPQKARLYHIEGTVRLKLTVNHQGQVIDVEILSGPAYGLREAALKLGSKLRFLPATDEHGQPKTADIEHEVVFRLRSETGVGLPPHPDPLPQGERGISDSGVGGPLSP